MRPIGDFYPDPKHPGRWIYDENAPNPGRNPAVTMIHPTQYPRSSATTHPLAEDLVDVPPRVDDWCEDRSPDELTDDDGRD